MSCVHSCSNRIYLLNDIPIEFLLWKELCVFILNIDEIVFITQPQIRWDYPLNLSISLSGGKETNKDFHGSGERPGKSPAPNPVPLVLGIVV